MLRISDLEAGYGKKQVLSAVSLEVRPREIVALIGPNGAGKSTVLKTVCGLVPIWNGEVRFGGSTINGSTPAQNVARGLTFAPQGNRVFDDLTVLENLRVGGFQLPHTQLSRRIHEVFQLFPVLKGRVWLDAGKLSGGEQQMLALARALIPQPKLLMLDEPSLGLSPSLACSVFDTVSRINQQAGVTILIVEQRVRDVLRIAHRAYGMRLGEIALEGRPDDILIGDDLKRLFLC